MFDPKEYEGVKDLSLPQLKTPVGQTLYIEILGPLHKSTIPAQDGKEPAVICTVRDLTVEDEAKKFVMIPGAAAVAELERAYPKEGYIGKQFMYMKGEKAAGKKANPVLLTEIKRKSGKK